MNVVEHQPYGYFLLEEAGEYYIEVNCEKGVISFSVLVQLNSSEKMHYLQQREKYLVSLATSMSNKADFSHPRNIKDKVFLDKSHKAIMAWKKHNNKSTKNRP